MSYPRVAKNKSLSRPFFIVHGVLPLSLSLSFSFVLPQLSPAASPPVPSQRSEPSPTVSTAAQAVSVVM
jgi:hypothetical protein